MSARLKDKKPPPPLDGQGWGCYLRGCTLFPFVTPVPAHLTDLLNHPGLENVILPSSAWTPDTHTHTPLNTTILVINVALSAVFILTLPLPGVDFRISQTIHQADRAQFAFFCRTFFVLSSFAHLSFSWGFILTMIYIIE